MKNINEIEEIVDIDKFIYNGENVWPIFRNVIGWEIAVSSNVTNQNNATENKINDKKLLIKLFFKNIFILIGSLFKKYDYLFFTTSDDYRSVDGALKNRLTETLIEKYNGTNILEIQTGSEIKKSSNQRTYLSYSIFLILKNLLSIFIKLNNINEMEEEIKSLGFKINVKKILQKYLAEKVIYNFVLKLYKPKKVFTTCYSFMPVIKCSNDLNIQTVEFQHGNIINHFAYDVKNNINSRFYPDYIIVFGSNTSKYLESRYYSANSIVAGNMLIDYYSKKKNVSIQSLREKFKYLICISLQWTVIEETITYIKEQANNFKGICFIFIPRKKDELMNYNLNKENLKVFSDINCYEIASNCDYHITCYSTCAIEVPSLGIENIFLNINGLSKKYLKNFIEEKSFNHLINLDEDIGQIIKKEKITKDKLMNENEDYISNNYKKNIDDLFNKLEFKA